MFSHAFQIATLRGIPVRVAPSWLVVAVLIVWSYRGTFEAAGRSTATTIALAAVAALLFTLSVLVHEIAHALEGAHRGAEVESITLFMLGGATALHTGDRRANDELAIAAIGPWSNVVLAAGLGLLAYQAELWGLEAAADVLGIVAWLNVGLALFNLFPGSPLDGGKVLRAGIWRISGDRHRGTVGAAMVGIVLSTLLVLGSAWLIWRSQDVLSGVWVGAIAAYMLRAARIELLRGRLGRWLARHSAGELAPPLPVLDAADTLDDARRVLADGDGHQAALVHDDDGPSGLLRMDALASAGPDTSLRALAQPLDGLPSLASSEPGDALANLLDRDQPFVLLVDDDGLWASSLQLIDREVRARRREARS